MKNRKAIVLLSGGIDSATTLYLAKSKGYRTHCIIFDYGQIHKKEILQAQIIAKKSNSPYQIIKISLPWKNSSLLDRKINLPAASRLTSHSFSKNEAAAIPSTYVPGRNIIFLSFALSFAEAIKAKDIFIGAHAQDYSGYPDCRAEFYKAFAKVISVGTKSGVEKRNITIKTPLLNKNKKQIIILGAELDVPFGLTWSCYRGDKRPCGRCDSCFYRAKGFREAKIEDPLLI